MKIATPPVKGQANKAVESLFTDLLKQPKGSVVIVSGKNSPQKVIEIRGLSEDDVLKRLFKNALNSTV